ncbi:MAG: hypothetical protein ACREBR_02770 [bacterium]
MQQEEDHQHQLNVPSGGVHTLRIVPVGSGHYGMTKRSADEMLIMLYPLLN